MGYANASFRAAGPPPSTPTPTCFGSCWRPQQEQLRPDSDNKDDLAVYRAPDSFGACSTMSNLEFLNHISTADQTAFKEFHYLSAVHYRRVAEVTRLPMNAVPVNLS